MNEPIEVLGLEHIYLTVSASAVSEAFYDTLLVDVLGFRKSRFAFGDEPHINYFNRHFPATAADLRNASNAAPLRLKGALGAEHRSRCRLAHLLASLRETT